MAVTDRLVGLVDHTAVLSGLVHHIINPAHRFIGSAYHAVCPLYGAVGKIGGIVQRLVRKALYDRKPVGDRVRLRSCVVQHRTDQVMQLIDIVRELVGNVLRKIHRHIGLCLSCDSADILTSVYFSGIFAGKNIAGLPADDSADIVTYMLIADRPTVGAVLDDPAGKSCDPSGIYRIVQRGRVVRLAVIVVQI